MKLVNMLASGASAERLGSSNLPLGTYEKNTTKSPDYSSWRLR